jgi:hypothetical protein
MQRRGGKEREKIKYHEFFPKLLFLEVSHEEGNLNFLTL